jgi:hypothetical protein
MNELSNTREQWKEFYKVKRFRTEFIVTSFLVILSLVSLANFLNYVEAREGVVLNDPLLNLFKPADLTFLSFGLIYISLFVAIFFLIKTPSRLVIALQAYIILVLVRIIAMYLVPLNPPTGMLSLSDPFVEYFGTGQLLTKDLFFSGHTATIFLFYLVSNPARAGLKMFFFICTILVAVFVLLQHVHYTIDVVSAPFFAFSAYKLSLKFNGTFNHSSK